MIKKKKRPVIIVGHGAKFNMKMIIELGEKLNAPIMTIFKGKGQIADHHPLGCGVLSRSGTPIASYFMNEADLIIAIGTSFSNHTGITPKKPTIQIDFDPLTLAKFHPVDVEVFGEIGRTVELLNNEKYGEKINQRTEIKERWQIWQSEKHKRLKENRNNGISSTAIFDALKKQHQKMRLCVSM